MALSPIQLYQQQQNPLAQILQGGNQTIASIFDRAVQIGRDMSNKQLQQEQDMMAMRKFETSMQQRRAENLQQNNEDAIKFARNAFESDRKFGVDQTQQQFQNERVTANDLFGQQTDTARLDIAREGLDIRKQDQQIQMDENKRKQDQAAQERAGVEQILGGGNKPPVTKEQYVASGGNPLFMGAVPDGTSASGAGDPNKRLGEIDAALGSKTLTLEQEARLRGERNSIVSSQKQDGGTGSPYAAKDQAMQEKAFQDSQAAKADKVMEEKVVGNTTAFTSAQVNEIKAYGDVAKVPQAKMADAQLYDKDRYTSEKASARRMTLPEYLKKGPQDAASQKAREELWNYVNLGGATPSAAPAAPAATGPQADLDKLLGR